MSCVTVTDATLAEVLGGSDAVVVDFWATWCGPCRTFKPQFEQAAPWFDATFATGLIDDCEQTVTGLGITTIPTVALYLNGELVAKVSGALTQQQLIDFLAENGITPQGS